MIIRLGGTVTPLPRGRLPWRTEVTAARCVRSLHGLSPPSLSPAPGWLRRSGTPLESGPSGGVAVGVERKDLVEADDAQHAQCAGGTAASAMSA